MVKPSLAQNRLGGPPTEVPIPSNSTQSSATCCGPLFFKPVLKPFQNPKPCMSAFGTQATGPTRAQSCTWMLKNKSRISSNCSFQISSCQIKTGYMIGSGFRVMLAFLVIQRPQQLEKGFLSSLGHNPSQPLVTASSSATAPSSPCVSPGILLSDGVQCLCWTMAMRF